MGYKILIIDQNHSIHHQLRKVFSELDYHIDHAFSGTEALAHLEKYPVDLAIMDLQLPDMGGFYLLQQIRYFSNVKAIVLSSNDEEAHCIRAFEEGAADYMTKSRFSPRELLLRVQAILRRSQPSQLISSQLRIDLIEQRVWLRGKEVHLGKRSFRLLSALASHPNQIRSHEELFEEIYDEDNNYDPRLFAPLIHKLRQLIEIDPKYPQVIQNIRGLGYLLNDKPA